VPSSEVATRGYFHGREKSKKEEDEKKISSRREEFPRRIKIFRFEFVKSSGKTLKRLEYFALSL
jgi:hypothetical protein